MFTLFRLTKNRIRKIWLSVKAGMGNRGTEWRECGNWGENVGNRSENAGNHGGNAGNGVKMWESWVGTRRMQVMGWDAENQGGNEGNMGGNAENQGGNAGNMGRNAGNRIEIEKPKWKFIKSSFLFTEIEKRKKLELS